MTDGGIAFCVSRRKKQKKPGSNGTIFSCQGFGQRVCWGDSTLGFLRLDRPHVACCVHSLPGVRLNEHIAHPKGAVVFQHACKMELEGIVSKRLGSRYRSGRSPDWLKFKNPAAPAVKREAEEDWGR